VKYIVVGVTLLLTLLYSGCGYKEGVRNEQMQASVYFTGNVKGVTVSIDGGKEFLVSPGHNNQYRIKPGVHNIRVYRGENIIVDRKLYIGDGIAKEIGVH
jgi:viroplasmin and RNaseH domain-containing protein